MNALNNLASAGMKRIQTLIIRLQNEEGSEVAQAAGVAILSAVVVGAILGLSSSFSGAILSAFNQLISKLR
ncbi:MAG: hypothetical protein H0X37_09780 [Herpetosiphonaceae bacterium]|nr:hypothetical protein [Herpetosiphonaceae bacterium]